MPTCRECAWRTRYSAPRIAKRPQWTVRLVHAPAPRAVGATALRGRFRSRSRVSAVSWSSIWRDQTGLWFPSWPAVPCTNPCTGVDNAPCERTRGTAGWVSHRSTYSGTQRCSVVMFAHNALTPRSWFRESKKVQMSISSTQSLFSTVPGRPPARAAPSGLAGNHGRRRERSAPCWLARQRRHGLRDPVGDRGHPQHPCCATLRLGNR